jgi:hypothetical protein
MLSFRYELAQLCSDYFLVGEGSRVCYSVRGSCSRVTLRRVHATSKLRADHTFVSSLSTGISVLTVFYSFID